MPLRLRMQLAEATLSTHEGLRLNFELRNEGSPPLEIPTPYDRSGSLQITIQDEQSGPLRTMSRITRQRMMSSGRIDSSLDVDTLATGQSWQWRMDMSSYGYLIPPGQFLVQPAYEYQTAGVSLRPAPDLIRVNDDPIFSIGALRDNPIIDSLTLLIEADTSEGAAYFLRQHNHNRPMGAWYSSRVLRDDSAQDPFLASAAFFQTEEIDPGYRKWIVWTVGPDVHARAHQDGRPTGETRIAALPGGASLIRSAVVTRDEKLYIFLWNQAGRIECHRLDPRQLEKIFEHQMRCERGALVSIGADSESIHIASHWRGILYDRLTWTGKPIERLHVFRSRFNPVSLVYEPSEQRIKGLFVEGSHGRSVQMAVASIKHDRVSIYAMDRLPLRESVNELAFDQDRRGRFHLLASTTGGKLYYFSEQRGPTLIAVGEDRFFPIVVAPLKIYLGCYRRDYGYRFLQYRRRQRDGKLLGLEPHPNLG